MKNYITPERERVALLTVNAQNDFVCADSPIRVPNACRILENLQRLISGFRARRRPIFHAVRLYRPDGSNVDAFRRQAVEEGMRVLMPGTRGAELLDQVTCSGRWHLEPKVLLSGGFQPLNGGEWVFYRPRWGAFHGTDLDERLEMLGITTLVVAGCSFSTSVRATLYEAGARDLKTILVTDAVAGAGEEPMRELARIGIHLKNTDTCLAWLERGGAPACAA